MKVTFEVPRELARFIAPKGSICVSGVSLTVNNVDGRPFDVMLVPHTRDKTSLDALAVGARVNLEVDLLARYVARLLECGRASATRRPTDASSDAAWTRAPPSALDTCRVHMSSRAEHRAEAPRARQRRHRRHPRGQDGHPRRRRGSRERRRPHDGRAVRHARGHQLHGHARARPHLPHAHRGAHRAARAADDGGARSLGPDARHGVHREHRGAPRRHDRHQRRRSRAHDARRREPRVQARRARHAGTRLPAPRAQRAASSCARARPKAPSISRASPGSRPPASSARS